MTTEETKPTAPRPEADPSAVLKEKTGIVRTLIAGALMGVANIIPGVSGGTMILALGLYERFVEAVADVTRLNLRRQSIIFLGLLVVSAVVAIGAMSVPIDLGLRNAHHLMFALFIGLTLGGVPVIYRAIKPLSPAAIAGAAAGLAVMIALFLAGTIQLPDMWITFLIAGIFGAAAMVLPGISGSYLLLIVGLYFPVVTAIKDFIKAGLAFEIGTAFGIGFAVLLPVGVGVLVGVAGLTNALRALLRKYHDATMGVLLGLLLGAVLGLYPFQEFIDRKTGEIIAPAPDLSAVNVVLAVVLVVAGIAVTVGASRLGGEETTDTA